MHETRVAHEPAPGAGGSRCGQSPQRRQAYTAEAAGCRLGSCPV